MVSFRCILTVAILIILPLAAIGPVSAWDLTRSVSDDFPPAIGIAGEPLVGLDVPDADPTFEDQLIELVNQERWSNGQLPPLKRVDLLDTASETHSTNMAGRDFVMHCDPDTGTMPWDRMLAAGYSYSSAAENIAWGYTSPESVIAGWMASSGHRANILSSTFREMGNGYFEQGNDQPNVRRTTVSSSCTPNIFNEGPFFRYWTQDFGGRNAVYPLVIAREAYLTESRDVDLYLYGSGWADDMRLRNETGAWTDWLTFASNLPWQLSSGSGTKTVTVELRNGATVLTSSDTIILDDNGELVFSDDFESGGTSSWSVVAP